MEEIDHQTFKVILVGDKGVGKKSIMRKYTSGDYQSNLNEPSPSFGSTIVEHKGTKIKLNIWIAPSIYSESVSLWLDNCGGLFFIYDKTNPESFENLKKNNIFLEWKKKRFQLL